MNRYLLLSFLLVKGLFAKMECSVLLSERVIGVRERSLLEEPESSRDLLSLRAHRNSRAWLEGELRNHIIPTLKELKKKDIEDLSAAQVEWIDSTLSEIKDISNNFPDLRPMANKTIKDLENFQRSVRSYVPAWRADWDKHLFVSNEASHYLKSNKNMARYFAENVFPKYVGSRDNDLTKQGFSAKYKFGQFRVKGIDYRFMFLRGTGGELHLLSIGPHENFYSNVSSYRSRPPEGVALPTGRPPQVD